MPGHDPQMLKGVLALLLLSLLAEREDYGYSVVVRLREAGFEGLNEGTVYPALTRLEASGLLEASLVKSSSGPARKYYRVTEQGTAHRARSLDDWHALVAGVEQITATPPSDPTSLSELSGPTTLSERTP